MKAVNPQDAFKRAKSDNKRVREKALKAVRFFLENEGKLFVYDEDLIKNVANYVDVDESMSTKIISHLASDQVDPVIHLHSGGNRLVGVSDFKNGYWWYGYLDYDDFQGPGKKAVCRQCIAENKEIWNVGQIFEQDINKDLKSYDDIARLLYDKHYSNKHPHVDPETVEAYIGASLATNTTINSNTAWHDGNITGGTGVGIGSTSVNIDTHRGNASVHHSKYTNSDAQSAINSDSDHGSTASHDYYAEVLQTVSPGGGANAVLDTGIDGSHRFYRVIIDHIKPNSSNSDYLRVQYSTDGGSSWVTGSSSYEWALNGYKSNGNRSDGSNGGDVGISLNIPNSEFSSGNQGYNGQLKIFKPTDNTLFTELVGEGLSWEAGSNVVINHIAGSRLSAESNNAIRLRWDDGSNFASGTVHLEGIS